MAIFSAKIKSIYTIKPRKMCSILFLVCFVVNFVYFFAFRYIEVTGCVTENNVTKNETVYIIRNSEFAQKNYGMTILINLYVIRDMLTLIIGIAVNIASAVFLKRYLKNKARTGAINNLKLMSSLFQSNLTLNSVPIVPPIKSKERVADRKASLMLLTLCLVNISTRTCLFIAEINFLYSQTHFSQSIYCLADILLVLSTAMSFFIFFAFDKNFNNAVWRVVGRSRSNSLDSNGNQIKKLPANQPMNL
jgi:hypothetical protein